MLKNTYHRRSRRSLAHVLLYLALLSANCATVSIAWQSDDETSISRDGGGQVGRGSVNVGGQCEQCTDVGGSKCTKLTASTASTTKCYHDGNPNLEKWKRKEFCLQTCADLGFGNPEKNCCPSSTDDAEDNRGDTNTGTCDPLCSDKTSWMMRKQVIRCPEVKNLATKCRQDWWKRWGLCRQSCYEAGAPYPGDECCGKDPVVEDDLDSNCHDCSDLATPWMVRNEKTCATWSTLKNRCSSNANRNKAWWTRKQWCRQSCFANGNPYPGDNCCVEPRNVDEEGSGDSDANPTASPTDDPTASPTRNPTRVPTASPTNGPTRAPNPLPTTAMPTASPSAKPTASPSKIPTSNPTSAPTLKPSGSPSSHPSSIPTVTKSETPSRIPSGEPTASPTDSPTCSPAPSGCVKCDNIVSPSMSKNNRTCSGDWPYLANTLCKGNRSSSNFITKKYCQQYCYEEGQRDYVNDCTGEPEACCVPTPPEPQDCMACTNQRAKSTNPNGMIATGKTCATWTNLPCENGGDYWNNNKWCQYSCWDQSKAYASDEKPCCELIPDSNCVQCEDNPSTYMVNNIPDITCENWGGLTETQCLKEFFQSTKSCQQSCWDIHNIAFGEQKCCPI